MKYQSTKNFSNERGLSCCFRQWRATHSHCSKLHGYALGFKFVFESETLDDRNWVVDFGGLKGLLDALKLNFDHTTAVAGDDPQLALFQALGDSVADVRVFPAVGCEAFAEFAYYCAVEQLERAGMASRVRVVSAECYEHNANSAIFFGDK